MISYSCKVHGMLIGCQRNESAGFQILKHLGLGISVLYVITSGTARIFLNYLQGRHADAHTYIWMLVFAIAISDSNCNKG